MLNSKRENDSHFLNRTWIFQAGHREKLLSRKHMVRCPRLVLGQYAAREIHILRKNFKNVIGKRMATVSEWPPRRVFSRFDPTYDFKPPLCH